MLSCKDVQDILTNDKKLSFLKKISLKIHLFICKNCRKAVKQYEFINSKIINIDIPFDKKDQSQIDDIINNVQINNAQSDKSHTEQG